MSDFKSKLAFFNQKKDDKKPEYKKSNTNQAKVQKAVNINNKPNEKFENGSTKKDKEQNQKNNIAKIESKQVNINNNIDKKEIAPKIKDEIISPIIKINKDNGQKNLKEEKIKNTVSSINTEASKIGKLINGKHPVYGSKKIGEEIEVDNKLEIYDYPLNIEYSSKEKSISILFVGQSGAGKSTFINAYVNHILGITKDDKIRYKLIIGDAKKEKDQTQSQTDFITIYNVRSLKYDNILFKLIDTPGAGDTRNENDKEKSELNKNKKEKEFLEMYNKLFSKEIGQLNSIVFVVKSSENRENEFQKRIVKNITNLFAEDIGKNCLAVLTHTDSDRKIPDAVQLMEKMEIFKNKTKNKEKWYFPVSSQSYFEPFEKDTISIPLASFVFTEKSLIIFTQILMSLKVYYTKETKRNLELKNRQENIIKILKENILDNLIINIKKLKDTEINLKQKIEECDKQQKEIEKIKDQVSHEEETKRQIQDNYELHSNMKKQKLEELRKNKEAINSLNNKRTDLEQKIADLTIQEEKAEKEKKEAEEKQKLLQKDINDIQTKINNKIFELSKKQGETLETEEIKKLRANLDNSKNYISQLENEIKSKEKEEETEEMKQLKNELDEKQKKIDALNNEINKKKSEGNSGQLNNLQATLDELMKNSRKIDEQLKNEKKAKEEALRKLYKNLEDTQNNFRKLNEEIYNSRKDYNKEIEELQESLKKKREQSEKMKNEIEKKLKQKEEFLKNKKRIEESRDTLLNEINNYHNEEKQLEVLLKEEEDKLNEQLNKQNKLLGLQTTNTKNLSEREESKIIEIIKDKLEKQIKLKKLEKNKKIKYNIKKLTDDNELNLICNTCERNCHPNCDCKWALFWNPIFACDMIESGKCIKCYHPKDDHKRIKKYYKTIEKERSLSPQKINDIEKEIYELQKNLDNRKRKARLCAQRYIL